LPQTDQIQIEQLYTTKCDFKSHQHAELTSAVRWMG